MGVGVREEVSDRKYLRQQEELLRGRHAAGPAHFLKHNGRGSGPRAGLVVLLVVSRDFQEFECPGGVT